MSLDTLQQFENPSDYWKIFRRDGDDLFTFIESNQQILQPDIFLDEKDYRKGNEEEQKQKAIKAEGIKYQKGWHCFTSEQDARAYLEYVFPNSHLFPERWYICKVDVREVLAKGLIKKWKCVVVRKIKILDK
jgi:hypothetical protein